MALKVADRVKETTNTQGTGTYTLLGAVTGFESFSVIGNGNTTYYCCTDGTNFEIGIGTYTASGTTLARTTILQSSDSDTAVNWAAGTREIFVTQPAEKAVFLNADGDIDFENTETRIKLESNAGSSGSGDPSISIAGGGPNYIRFHDGTNFSSTTNAVDIVYRTGPNDLLIERSSGENIAEFGGDDGHAALYFNDSKKLETVSGGIDVTGEIAATSLDISGDVDVDGTLEADAMTLNGTAITTTATLSTGISNNNVPKFTSGVADNDFLRVDGTAIEGRSASEVLSDIGGQASLTFGISNTNAVKIDSASVADDEFARFTANGLESRSTSEVRSDIGLGTAAVLDTGISNTNVPKFTSGVADDDFLRVNGTDIEGRSASEVLSDIAAMPLAGGTFTGDVTLQQSDDGSSEDPQLILNRVSSSPADNDTLGTILFRGRNDAGEVINYAKISSQIADASDGTEDGFLSLQTVDGGSTNNTFLRIGGGNIQLFRDTIFQGDNYNVQWDKSEDTLEFADNAKIAFGAGDDISLHWDGTDGHLAVAGTLNIEGSGETLAKFIDDGAVELYHDNSKKLETTADGMSVSGDVLALTSTDAGTSAAPSLQLYRNSSSPADDDDIGQIQFFGQNDAGTPEKIEYGRIDVKIEDASDGTEDAALDLVAMRSGSSLTYQRMSFGLNQFYKNILLSAGSNLLFEGATSDDYETVVTVTDPTADRTITLPDATGTVITTGNLSSITSTGTLTGLTVNGDVTFTGDNYNIVFDKSDDALEFADNAKATFGAGRDLQVYHNAANSFIDNYTGDLYIRDSGGDIYIQAKAGENSAAFKDDGAVELYHDNSKKLETASGGITVTGEITTSSGTVAVTNGNAVLLNTTTVSSGVSSVDFGSSLITDTYDDYLLVVSGATVSALTRLRIRLGTSNAQDTSGIYVSRVVTEGRALDHTATSTDTPSRFINTSNGAQWQLTGDSTYETSPSSTAQFNAVIRLSNLRSTAFHKTFQIESMTHIVQDHSGGTDDGQDYYQTLRVGGGVYKTATAVNFIRFFEHDFGSQINGGTFSLYGLPA